MANDPRRDSRAQRAQQVQTRYHSGPPQRQLYPVLEMQEPEEEEEVDLDGSLEETGDVVMQRADHGSRFFADELQETTIPVEDWNEQHPLWLALKKGDVKIVTGPDGQDVVVTRDAYVRSKGLDLFPTQDYGKPDVAVIDQAASLAQLKYELAKTMVAYVSTDFAQAGSPLLDRPVQANGTVPPVGGKVLCAALDFGHKGSGEYVIYDVPQSQIVKAPFAGSFGKLSARQWPKYYKNDDNNLVANTRVYLLTPGGQRLTTELWNSVPSALIAQQGGEINVTPVPCKGWIAEGFLSNDDKNRPIRRFYGSVKCTGVIAQQPTRIPIAFASTFVMLVGGKYDTANPTLQSLQFIQNLQPTSGVPIPTIGPFNVNEMVELDSQCVSIDVINSPNVLGGGAVVELPFEMLFFLSF